MKLAAPVTVLMDALGQIQTVEMTGVVVDLEVALIQVCLLLSVAPTSSFLLHFERGFMFAEIYESFVLAKMRTLTRLWYPILTRSLINITACFDALTTFYV